MGQTVRAQSLLSEGGEALRQDSFAVMIKKDQLAASEGLGVLFSNRLVVGTCGVAKCSRGMAVLLRCQ